MNPDFADLAARQFPALGVNGNDGGAGARQADAVDVARDKLSGHHGRG